VTTVTASNPDAVIGVGAAVTLTLGLNEAVTVDLTHGTPKLTLNNGATAQYVSGSGTNALNFGYVVAAGQDIPDLAVSAANLNSATVTDLAGNAANLSGAAANPAGTLDIKSIAAFDTTSSQSIGPVGQAYSGPVAGLQDQYINISSDSLNIAASTPNWFIHSGSGNDGISVVSGTNVLDGGTGSNFLTGGTGADTFFVDDRGATSDIWSSLSNFHAGDSATIWGVTPATFVFDIQDNQGATGFKGLTIHATGANSPVASVTFAGYAIADITSGRISMTSGSDPVSGSTYTNFVANS
jgi:hypothetical protein